MRAAWGKNLRRRWGKWGLLYLLVAPTILGTALFAYYPNLDVFVKTLYKWEPANGVVEYTGAANFLRMLSDIRFWNSFQLVLMLLAANAIKMWPSIFAAVLLHRLRSDRLRYICQVLFVMPMVIPMLVWLLMWKNFLDPNVGIINRALNSTGAIHLLEYADERMWKLADLLYPINRVLDLLFASGVDPARAGDLGARASGLGVWGFMIAGVSCLALATNWEGYRRRVFLIGLVFIALAVIAGWKVLLIFPVCYLVSRTVVGREGPRLVRLGTRLGTVMMLAGMVLVLLTKVWTQPTGAFDYDQPIWLGHTALVIPTLMFWGFPWITTMGVLIYLSGLQGIPEEVYEAGELDGLGSWGRFRHIEFPLIMGQIRIMLILMTIWTLNDYGTLLLLLGPEGGPAGIGMVPGLYMYNQAFKQGAYGYACALGVLMFVLILIITIIYQRYVRVEK